MIINQAAAILCLFKLWWAVVTVVVLYEGSVEVESAGVVVDDGVDEVEVVVDGVDVVAVELLDGCEVVAVVVVV